jgi:hypothetical protein
MRKWAYAVTLTLVAAGCSGGGAPADEATRDPVAESAAATVTAPATAAATLPVTSPGASATTETSAAPPPTTEQPTSTTAATPAGPELVTAIEADLAASPEGCDVLDPRHCYLPFPSDALTVADPVAATGRRVALPAAAAPTNASGVAVDVAEWNRNDGFSPNTTILTYVAGLDAAASALPPWTDLDASLAADSPVVLAEVATGDRVALWAELDAHADSDADRLLVVHPAVALTEGHTYAVGLRHLVGTGGASIEPSAAFRAWRDNLTTEIPAIEDRRPEIDAALEALDMGGGERADWQLAWSFTVASTANVTGRMLHLRDEALAALGAAPPAFTVTAVVDDPVDDEGQPRTGIARQVTGTFEVPNYLTGDGSPGNRFHYDADLVTDPDALPTANGTLTAPFACNIPPSVLHGTAPGHLVQYGHGLLGSHLEINAGNVRRFTDAYGLVVCATKWAGMSEDDIANAAATLQDLSNFPTMADRLQQGVLNQLVLTRLMTSAQGLAADPAFQRPDGSALLDLSGVVYDGNSQGGVMGLMVAGVSTDIERFVLGVPGMNYGLLLPRSADFATYEAIFDPAYPNDLDRTLLLALLQMLWDRGEGAGYVQHVTSDPLPGTPAKTVLLHVAFGDHQVSELAAMVEARTLSIPIHRPVAAPGRSRENEPGWGLDTIAYPATGQGTDGSGIIVWDSGAAPIPLENLPPTAGEDPHGDPRADPDVQRQKYTFLFEGQLVDVCATQACTADPA